MELEPTEFDLSGAIDKCPRPPAGTCGPAPVIGLMVPSVDRVGRYFPLTLVANLPPDVNPIAAATESGAFFDRAERLIIETLATDDIDFEHFDAQVVNLGSALESIVPPRVVLDQAGAAILADAGGSSQPRTRTPDHAPQMHSGMELYRCMEGSAFARASQSLPAHLVSSLHPVSHVRR